MEILVRCNLLTTLVGLRFPSEMLEGPTFTQDPMVVATMLDETLEDAQVVQDFQGVVDPTCLKGSLVDDLNSLLRI